ncbi:hypothetical protein DM01DRAFT_1386286 [Hesseltinella vesiculosa]|uniref:Uncharacterized protein n=1 Tax=Hesseltinella vesiculosa TaxID=101127 RepID=A0A1X2G6I4_9FUNG|nr:hypothetical protein DM01DRAFT_1386286 [Hesseltinella vesiculosa]
MKLFSINYSSKKSKSKKLPKPRHSPTHSISSASSAQSSLDSHYDQEVRGIFRTLEPVWSHLPNGSDQWQNLAPNHQQELEHTFSANASHTHITIQNMSHPVRFAPAPPKKQVQPLAPSQRRRPVTQFFANKSVSNLTGKLSPQPSMNDDRRKSMPPSHNSSKEDVEKKGEPISSLLVSTPSITDKESEHLDAKTSPSLLQLGDNLRRSMVPSWWFEQDDDFGRKGMVRFDYKNQVRLEALSDGRSSLIMTDASFPTAFKVRLEPADRSLAEEWRGFMYLATPSLTYQPHLLIPVDMDQKRSSFYHLPNQLDPHLPQIQINNHDFDVAFPPIRRSSL